MKNRPLTSPKKLSPKKESKSPKNKSPIQSPKKLPIKAEPMEEDITHFEDASISILQQVDHRIR